MGVAEQDLQDPVNTAHSSREEEVENEREQQKKEKKMLSGPSELKKFSYGY